MPIIDTPTIKKAFVTADNKLRQEIKTSQDYMDLKVGGQDVSSVPGLHNAVADQAQFVGVVTQVLDKVKEIKAELLDDSSGKSFGSKAHEQRLKLSPKQPAVYALVTSYIDTLTEQVLKARRQAGRY